MHIYISIYTSKFVSYTTVLMRNDRLWSRWASPRCAGPSLSGWRGNLGIESRDVFCPYQWFDPHLIQTLQSQGEKFNVRIQFLFSINPAVCQALHPGNLTIQCCSSLLLCSYYIDVPQSSGTPTALSSYSTVPIPICKVCSMQTLHWSWQLLVWRIEGNHKTSTFKSNHKNAAPPHMRYQSPGDSGK